MIESTLPKLLIFIEQGYSKELVGKNVYRTTLGHSLSLQESGFSVGRKPVRAINMKITIKIRKDLLLLKCYARPNNPRQAERSSDEGE